MLPVYLLLGQSNMAGRCHENDIPTEFLMTSTTSRTTSNAIMEATAAPTNCSPTKSVYGDIQFQMCWDCDSNFRTVTSTLDSKADATSSHGTFLPLTCQFSPGLDRQSYFGPEFGIAATLGPRLLSLAEKEDLPRPSVVAFIKFALGSTNLHTHWNPKNPHQVVALPTFHSGKEDFLPSSSNSSNNSNNNCNDVPVPPASKRGYYHRMISHCRGALDHLEKAGVKPRIAGVFWLQGESDSGGKKSKDAEAYAVNFEAFMKQLSEDLKDWGGIPHVVVSPVVWKGKHVDIVNKALHEDLPKLLSRNDSSSSTTTYHCIDPLPPRQTKSDSSLTFPHQYWLQKADAGVGRADHLTAEAICDIGRRMGLAMPISQ